MDYLIKKQRSWRAIMGDAFGKVLAQYIRSNIYSKRALISGCIALALLFSALDDFIGNFVPDVVWRGLGYLIILMFWFLCWIINRNKYPRRTQGKIGIVFSIETDKSLAKSKLYVDFTKSINKNIYEKGLGDIFEVIILDEYQSEITSRLLDNHRLDLSEFREKGKFSNTKRLNQWEKHHKKIQGNFYIWGNIRKRKDGEQKYFLDLNGLVTHTPLDVTRHTQFTNEFIQSWFKRISFGELFEFRGFETSAELILIPTQYIIGLAALISGNPELALNLHNKLLSELNSPKEIKATDFPNISRVKAKLIDLIVEESTTIASWYSKTGNIQFAKKYADIADSVSLDSYATLLLRTIIAFQEKDINKSIEYATKAKKLGMSKTTKVAGQTWRYNYAFLLMWIEDYKKAIYEYGRIIEKEYPLDDVNLNEVYIFNTNLISNNVFLPSNFIIGYLMYRKDGNGSGALEYLEKFISGSVNNSKYKLLREIAIPCTAEIKDQIGIT